MQQSTSPNVVFLSKNPSQAFRFAIYGNGILRVDHITLGCIGHEKELNALGLRLYNLGTIEYLQTVVRNREGQIITNKADIYQLSAESTIEIKVELQGSTYMIEITIK